MERAFISWQTERQLAILVVVNLALQLFDVVLTYLGLHAGFGEGKDRKSTRLNSSHRL